MDADRVGPLITARPGQRWVIRRRLPDGSATDVIGWLDDPAASPLELFLADGTAVRIEPATVIAARRAPAAAGGRSPLRVSAAELERIALPGWLAEHEPLGQWTLRSAGGFTGRANSCLAVGDPGLAYPAAAELICEYARTHQIEPRAQVIVGSEEDQGLRALGWRPTYVATDVLVCRLVELLGESAPDPAVGVAETLTDSWVAGYQQSRPNDADPRWLRMILDGRPPRAFAGASDGDGDGGGVALFGIGRGQLEADWLGLASIWVREDRRRAGWGRSLMCALGHWAARRGARWSYLQVASENTAAIAAYERLGFVHHHTYGYLTPP